MTPSFLTELKDIARLAVPIVVGLLVLLGPWVFDIHMGVIPAWVK